MNTKKKLLATMTISALVSVPAMANTWEGEAKDAWLDGKVETALMMNTQINSFRIDTDVNNGVAILSGEIDTKAKRDLALQLASNVDGIKEVRNQITVAPDPKEKSWKGSAKDAWIDGRVETALMFNTEVNNFKIDTEVNNGIVMLTGEVGSEAKKDLAGRIAAKVDGVSSVINKLTVKEGYEGEANEGSTFARKMRDMAVTAGLNIEFAAHSELEATRIDIDTKNGAVELTGDVKSQAAKDLAVEIAKGYDDVTSVKDNLRVVN